MSAKAAAGGGAAHMSLLEILGRQERLGLSNKAILDIIKGVPDYHSLRLGETDEKGNTAFVIAFIFRNAKKKIAEEILKQDWANPETLHLRAVNNEGNTTFMMACSFNASVAMQILKKPWANPDTLNMPAVNNNGNTAFMEACGESPSLVIEILKKKWANAETLNTRAAGRYGGTALSKLC